MSSAIHMNQGMYDMLTLKARRSKSEPAEQPTASPDGWREVPHTPHPTTPPVAQRHGTMTKTERAFLANVLRGKARFEAVTLKLAGGSRYTPDFVTREGGVTTFYEVKGSYRLGSEGRAHTAFHEAASQFPWCRFVWAVQQRGGAWRMTRIEPLTDAEDIGEMQS